MTNHETADPTETDRLHAEILEGRAQISELRDLLRSENQRANAAIARETTAEQAAIEAEEQARRLGLMVDEYGAGASALTDKLRRVRDLHRETCLVARSDVPPTSFTCGLCEVLDAPAAVSVPPPAPRADDQAALRDRIAERPERYAVAIHDAMESDLSLVDQEPGQQALFARAAEAVMALADSEQATLRRKLAAAEKIRENADFHLGQEMARRQLAEKEAARLSADQAAVLNAAAQHLYTALFPAVYDDMGQKAAEGVNRAVSELRRLAAVSGPCVAGEQQNETPEADVLRCVCGDPVQLMDENDPASWIHSPGSDTRCLEARPRCPHCQMPHDLTPESLPVATCAGIRHRIAEAERSHTEGDHSLCCRRDCEALRQS